MRPNLALAVAAIIGFATDARAQANCATIADPANRLACYDSAATPQAPAWTGNIERDVMTDQERRSLGTASAQLGCIGQPAILALVCIEPTLVMVLNTGCFVGEANSRHEVQYRVDGGAVTNLTMIATANRRALGTQSAPRLRILLQNLAAGDEVHFRIAPPSDSAQTFTFQTAGLAEEAAQIDMGCGVQDALAGTQ